MYKYMLYMLKFNAYTLSNKKSYKIGIVFILHKNIDMNCKKNRSDNQNIISLYFKSMKGM
jgi:hypothetical protein